MFLIGMDHQRSFCVRLEGQKMKQKSCLLFYFEKLIEDAFVTHTYHLPVDLPYWHGTVMPVNAPPYPRSSFSFSDSWEDVCLVLWQMMPAFCRKPTSPRVEVKVTGMSSGLLVCSLPFQLTSVFFLSATLRTSSSTYNVNTTAFGNSYVRSNPCSTFLTYNFSLFFLD